VIRPTQPFIYTVIAIGVLLAAPGRAHAQASVPAPVQNAADEAESALRRFGAGVSAGVALDPELIMFGAHARFGPIFTPAVTFRPGIDFGVGEVTTLMGIHLDVLYTFPGATRGRWSPYIGAGPNFTLSHRGFETTETDKVNTNGTTTTTGTATTTTTSDQPNRFDFSDTDFDGGFNFLAGARRGRMFLEMKATAYGVANVRLMAGFNF